MRKRTNIKIPKKKINEFCKRNHIRKLSFFGSVLGNNFKPASDVDVLVEFESGHTVGYIRLAGLEIELSEILGHKVDLRTAEELSPYFRQEVIDLAEVQYAEG